MDTGEGKEKKAISRSVVRVHHPEGKGEIEKNHARGEEKGARLGLLFSGGHDDKKGEEGNRRRIPLEGKGEKGMMSRKKKKEGGVAYITRMGREEEETGQARTAVET